MVQEMKKNGADIFKMNKIQLQSNSQTEQSKEPTSQEESSDELYYYS